MKRKTLAAIVLLSCVPVTPALAGGVGHTDFEIGQDGSAAHTLLVEGDADILAGLEPVELAPLNDPFSTLDGWFIASIPGWEGLEVDEPGQGIFALLADHQIALQRTSFGAGFSMFDDSENPILTGDGTTYVFPSDAEGGFHIDLVFAAASGTPLGSEFSAGFLLTDLAGIHGDSQPFTLSFVTVPEPGTLAMSCLGVTLVGLRRKAER